MKSDIYICFFILLSCISVSKSQTAYYSVESFQDSYNELDSFNSIYNKTGFLSYTDTFDLDFDFPVYDRTFDQFLSTSQSIYRFGDSSKYYIYLFFFGYLIDNPLNPDSIESDFRYVHLDLDTQKAFVMQYTKARLFTDTSVEEYDSYINFQTWLYENGDIEIRFGESNLANSPNYVPEEGFYQIYEDFDPIIGGPRVGILCESDDRAIGLHGPYNSYRVEDEVGTVTTLPPNGWVIRFNRELYTSANIKYDKSFYIYPNPVYSTIFIETDKKIDRVIMYSFDGKLIKSLDRNIKQIDVSEFPNGIYFLLIHSDDMTYHKKIVKH